MEYKIKIDSEELCKQACELINISKTSNTWKETWTNLNGSKNTHEALERCSCEILNMPLSWNTLFYISNIEDDFIEIKMIAKKHLDTSLDISDYNSTVKWLENYAEAI